MTVTAISGQHLTNNILSNRLVIDMSDEIAWYEPSANPFLSLLMRMSGERKAESYKVEWLEKQPNPYYVTASAAADTSGASTLTIADYALLRVGMVIINERTGEVIRVTATPSTSTVTVYRGAGTTHAAILGTDKLYIAGSSEGQGQTSPVSRSIKEDAVYNYTQIFKRTCDGSRTLEQSKLYGTPDRATEVKWQGIEHSKEIERAMFWGELGSGTDGDSKPLYLLKGLFSPKGFVQTNRTDMGASFTEDDFIEALQPIFAYGSPEKFAFCGLDAMRAISAFPRDRIQVIQPTGNRNEISYGLALKTFEADFGRLHMVWAKQWRGDVFSHAMGIVDMAYVKPVYLQKTVLQTNIQENDRDGWKDQWLTECSLEVKLEQCHGYLYNM